MLRTNDLDSKGTAYVWCDGNSGSALTSQTLMIKNNIQQSLEAMFADVDL